MPSSMPVATKPRPYRRFVTSALHTRFVHAAAIALLWHLAIAGLASDWYSSIPAFFWAFFPLGTAGIKAGLFSLSSLLVFMLQIATLKIGRRCTPSNWISIRTVLLSYSTYGIFAWYLASAWWFCEVFVFTSPASQELGWIINGGYGAPDKLNERPIYLRHFFLLLGLTQAVFHIYYDASALRLRSKQVKGNKEEGSPAPQNSPFVATLVGRAPVLLKQAAITSGVCTLAGPFLYTAFSRRFLWSMHIWGAKAFANISRSDAKPPQGFYIGGIMLKGLVFGVLLSFTWQLNVLLFEAYMLQEPLKNSLLLSTSSKDPNGTLVNGLRAKRDLVKTFAFWELDLIAEKYPDRRKDLFGDFERPGQSPIFTQVVTAALEVLNLIEARMDELDPPPTASAPSQPSAGSQAEHLPRILPSAVPSKNQIFLPENPTTHPHRLDRITSFVSHEAKTLGSSPNPWSPPVERYKQRAIEYSSPAVKDLQSRAEAAQQSPVGRYLLTSPTRLIKSAIQGTPTSNPALTIFAITSITNLLVVSLQEDTYGKAVQNVPVAVQSFTKTIFSIEAFVRKHTNGGLVSPVAAKELSDVQLILDHLRASLNELLHAFRVFLNDVGLGIRDLNDAQKAAETRDLVRVIQPAPKVSPAVAQGLGDRVSLENGTSNPQNPNREMEEVSEKSRQVERRRRSEQNEQTQRGRGQQQQRRAIQDNRAAEQRPGRLFNVLDGGSGYEEGLRERRKSVGQKDGPVANPLVAGTSRQRASGSERSASNPFGAREPGFENLPAGGLQQRRVTNVR